MQTTIEYAASPKAVVEYVASVKARQQIFRNGLIIYRLNSGEAADALAAEHGITTDEMSEIIYDWSDGSPSQEYLERQFAIHVAWYMPPPPPPSPEELVVQQRAEQRYLAEQQAEWEAARVMKRAAREHAKARRQALGPNYFSDRQSRMVALRRSGLTLQAVAEQFGISRERVRQILAGHDRHDLAERRHLKRRRGRPIDMGGPRGVWIDCDLAD